MSDFKISDTFEPATREAWLRLVDKVLKGADFKARLIARTADGLEIEPLYTRAEAVPGADTAVPGQVPFARGTGAGAADWDIRQLHAETDPERANAAILEDLQGGATSILLQIAAPGWFGLPYNGDAIARALKGVRLELCPIWLQAGEYTCDAAGSLMALWRTRGIEEPARAGGFNADPLGTLAATGALYHPIARSLEIAARLAADSMAMPKVTALAADGHVYHAAGASEAQELALMLATLVAYLRAMEAASISPREGLPKIAISLAADTDQFLTVAKLRAARRLIWRVAEVAGAGEEAARVPFTAMTAWRMLTKRDPWVNMLRTTMACAAAAMGGADAIVVLPFTWALGQPDAFARRIARNTHLVLQEESSLGRVRDPAGGSWYVEKLSDDLAKAAWALFQQIEAKGGMAEALLSGQVQDTIAATAAARAVDIATGKLELTGTSAFPMLRDDGVKVEPHPDPLPADLNGLRIGKLRLQRLSAPFERLRDAADAFAAKAGHRPRVFLASLGALAEHAGRATLATNFLAAGGIEAVTGLELHSAADAARAFASSGTSAACIAASDRHYELAEATARALKAAGAKHILLAGRPGAHEAQLRGAVVDGFIHAGCDRVAMLGDLQAALGIHLGA